MFYLRQPWLKIHGHKMENKNLKAIIPLAQFLNVLARVRSSQDCFLSGSVTNSCMLQGLFKLVGWKLLFPEIVTE